jgi:hypothetical protein
VHFISSASPKVEGDDSIFGLWETSFLNGLENLLVECAVISDEIERDCFISRVYCWFSDKLSDRREVPRTAHVEMEELASSVRGLNSNAKHTLQGLHGYDHYQSVDHRSGLMNDSPNGLKQVH